jgi:hypothetical protein
MRRAVPADADEIATFNGWVHTPHGATEPDLGTSAWTLDLFKGNHPTIRAEDFLVVEDMSTGTIVSTMSWISQVWNYSGVPFKVGRPELVGTDPAYRNRGLVRAQFEEVHRWSAERGELAQAITGLRYYYRQFGYEMTLALQAGRLGYRVHVPRLAEGEEEQFNFVPASEEDIPFISGLYERAAQRYLVSVARDPAMWNYELSGRREQSVYHCRLLVIRRSGGEAVGFLAHPSRMWGPTFPVQMYELLPGVSWNDVTPAVLRYAARTGEAYAREGNGPEFGAYFLALGTGHPVYEAIHSHLPRKPEPYTYYMRVPDLPAFLRHVAPALNRRLEQSPAAGYTGDLKLNFYRAAHRITFEQGALVDAAQYTPEHQEDGDAFFPDKTFLHLLFGHRTLEEVEYMFADCLVRSDRHRLLLKALFPRGDSFVMPIS